MPCKFEILPEHDLLFCQYQGVISFFQFRAFLEEIWDAEGYHPGLKNLTDLRQARLDFTPTEIEACGEFLLESPDALRGPAAALVASPMETAFGVIMAQYLESIQEIAVFSTWEESCAYLGLKGFEDPLKKNHADSLSAFSR